MKRCNLSRFLMFSIIIMMFVSCKKEKNESNLPLVKTVEVSNIDETTVTCGGNIASDGNSKVTERGVCWSAVSNATILGNHTSDGSGIGSFTSNISGLTGNMTYYVRAYATNSVGTAYGEEKVFKTKQTNNSLPTVSSATVSNISSTTATCGGNVTSDGNSAVTAKGVCWSTSQNPTIANSKTNDGQGLGQFTSSITGLTAGTTYYVRAYATNSNGTAYGVEKNFIVPGWKKRADFLGIARHGAIGIAINDKGYIGLGYSTYKHSDLWEYSPNSNSWAQKASLPKGGGAGAVAFTIGNKGYIGGVGSTDSYGYSDEFWEYNPSSNSWLQKADIPGGTRSNATGFAIGDKGYVCGGNNYGSSYSDLRQYNPTTNSWTQKNNFGGSLINHANCFVIGNNAYVGIGSNQGYINNHCQFFWKYNTTTNTWSQIADFGGGKRLDAISFAIGNYGYVGTGESTNYIYTPKLKDMWKYNSASNTWTQIDDAGTQIRSSGVGFVINNKAYIGLGYYYSSSSKIELKDFWEYTPE